MPAEDYLWGVRRYFVTRYFPASLFRPYQSK